jgi:phosphoribosylformylglycinamidine cyclo-ligase
LPKLATTYAQAGVSIAEGDRFVREIRKSVRSTYTRGVVGDIGAFGGFFDGRFKGMRSPVLVSSVDGVGTKLIVAQAAGRHDTVGEDLVNHCVNDIAVCGATPLFFLDYFATGKLRVDVAADVIRGFAKACRENRCSLIGGETAEMPGMYGEDCYDLAGTIVGVVDRKSIVNGKTVRKGDVLIGLPSTGLHTNGYSLARAVLLRQHALSDRIEELGMTLADALLTVHRSYIRPVQRLLRTGFVRGLAHITGGGIVGNTRRVLPTGLALAVDWNAWERPPLFRLIQRLGEVPEDDMRRTFNCGIGLIAIVARASADRILRELRTMRERAFIVGEVVAGKDGER